MKIIATVHVRDGRKVEIAYVESEAERGHWFLILVDAVPMAARYHTAGAALDDFLKYNWR